MGSPLIYEVMKGVPDYYALMILCNVLATRDEANHACIQNIGLVHLVLRVGKSLSLDQ
jgi:hypothetical protein